MRRLTAVLLWSVIAAAFIGPGTVTTAASAGASYGFRLLWALLFSTVACLVLQEASGRLTIVSGESLARFLRTRYSTGIRGGFVLFLVCGAILVGCAAYQAGNILGGVAGAALASEFPEWQLTVGIGLIVWGLLWFQTPAAVARSLSVIVAIMGIAFLWTAWRLAPPIGELVRGALVPRLPASSAVRRVTFRVTSLAMAHHAIDALLPQQAANQALAMVGRGGFEPPTPAFSVLCSTN